MEIHDPVLADSVLTNLNVQKGGTYIDATLNGGGHTKKILEKTGKGGMVLGIEWDAKLVEKVKKEQVKGLIVCEANYVSMRELIKELKIKKINGILFDFGISSWHLEGSGRGFSFQKNEKLDMRFSEREENPTAAAIVNSFSARDLKNIFLNYGEEPRAGKIADAIVSRRREKRILTANELVGIVAAVSPKRVGRRHPATKIFQALRIAVNRELENIQQGIQAAISIVAPGGRVVAISYQSLEDRIVKNAFRAASEGHALTKKPIRASSQEVSKNPRSRSALLRVWEKAI